MNKICVCSSSILMKSFREKLGDKSPYTFFEVLDDRIIQHGNNSSYLLNKSKKIFKKCNCNNIIFIFDVSVTLDNIYNSISVVNKMHLIRYDIVPGIHQQFISKHPVAIVFSSRMLEHKSMHKNVFFENLKARIPNNIKNIIRPAYHFFIEKNKSKCDDNDGSEPKLIATENSVSFYKSKTGLSDTEIYVDLGDRQQIEKQFVDEVNKNWPYPRTIMVALSNSCNYSCVMCPYHSKKLKIHHKSNYFDEKKYMSTDLLEKLCREIKNEKINFHFGEFDEPAMHPKIGEAVKIISDNGKNSVHITSNGSLWTEKLAEKIIENGLTSVSFSVDALSPKVYKEIRGGNVLRTTQNIIKFLELKEKINPKISVNLCIINQGNAKDEVYEFKEFWKNQGVTSVSLYGLFELVDTDNYIFDVKNKYYNEDKRTPCSALWDQCFIYPGGEISLCCTTLTAVPRIGVVSMGNLYNETLKSIWTGKKYSNIRTNLIRGNYDKYSFCKKCSHWSATYQYEKKYPDGTKNIYNENESFFFFKH